MDMEYPTVHGHVWSDDNENILEEVEFEFKEDYGDYLQYGATVQGKYLELRIDK